MQAVRVDPKKRSEKWINQLGEISNLFLKSCFTIPDAHVNFSERIYIFYKILYIQSFLCEVGFPNWSRLEVIPPFDINQHDKIFRTANAVAAYNP